MYKRTRTTVATATVLSLVVSLSSCATKEQTGELVGTGVGIAVGAAFGEGSGQVAAILVGGLVGSLVGKFIGRSLDEADQRKATEAAQRAASLPQGQRVTWVSNKNAGVSGYAEPLGSPAPVTGTNAKFCFDPNYKTAYQVSGEKCAGKDYFISEADFRQRANTAAPASSIAVGPTTQFCFDPRYQTAYGISNGKCVGQDQLISEAEYRQRTAVSTEARLQPIAAPVAVPVVQATSPSGSCRRVHEVLLIQGNETKTDSEYCLRGGQWTRA
jgi:surface antigen